MTRPAFEEIYLNLAADLARRSSCTRLQVGAVITSWDFTEVFSVGYNGNAAKLPNGCDSPTPGACGCLHAEDNAALKCAAPRSESKVVFVTDLPCVMCAKRLINLGGVARVLYEREYRITTGIDTLVSAGIRVERWGRVGGAAVLRDISQRTITETGST